MTPAPHLLCRGNLNCLLFYRHREVVVREEGLEKTTRVELVDLEPLLSCPFCWPKTYVPRTLPEVTSQAKSCITHICILSCIPS